MPATMSQPTNRDHHGRWPGFCFDLLVFLSCLGVFMLVDLVAFGPCKLGRFFAEFGFLGG